MDQNSHSSMLTNVFDLTDDQRYRAWREQKLAAYPQRLEELLVPVENPHALSKEEILAIQRACSRANMAIYTTSVKLDDDTEAGKSIVADIGRHFGLVHLDSNIYADDEGISALQVSTETRQFEYIPYSNKAIRWHTDGYYNLLNRKIRAMILHCVRPAARGGENALMDHEIVYLMMRDKNPQFIDALMQPDVMTIPANIEKGVEIRAEQTGPVFSVDEHSGQLHMRYTARTRSIIWKQDPLTESAVKYLQTLMDGDSAYIFKYRLKAGQGLICNNILHTRSAFEENENSTGRLVYRARYYDSIQ